MIWSKLTSFMLCCSTVRKLLKCILWVGTMWRYWTARIPPLLSTGRWQILTLFSSHTTILKNVSCTYAPRVLVLLDLQSSAVTIIGPLTVNMLQSMCYLDRLLLLSVYVTGSSTYYILHGAGCRVLNILLIHPYVTVIMSFGYGCTVVFSTQFIIVLIILFHSYRYLTSDYTFCACQP